RASASRRERPGSCGHWRGPSRRECRSRRQRQSHSRRTRWPARWRLVFRRQAPQPWSLISADREVLQQSLILERLLEAREFPGYLLYKEEWPLPHFVADTPKVLAEHPNNEELDAAQHQDEHDDRRPSLDAAAIQPGVGRQID